MNGSIAQIVALTAHANALLHDTTIEYTLNNSTAQFCKEIRFVDWVPSGIINKLLRDEKYEEKPVANNFKNWVLFLKEINIKRLYLHYFPSETNKLEDRISSGFVGGGGRWLIEANKDSSSDWWEARWEVTNRDSKDNRIWAVTYARIARDDIVLTSEHSGIKGLSSELDKALYECKVFAEKHDLDYFHDRFNNAINCLQEGDCSPKVVYHQDWIPKQHYSIEAQRILSACQPAWVFGGMGSWNDIGFDGDEHYEKISNNLFYILCETISHATNEFI